MGKHSLPILITYLCKSKTQTSKLYKTYWLKNLPRHITVNKQDSKNPQFSRNPKIQDKISHKLFILRKPQSFSTSKVKTCTFPKKIGHHCIGQNKKIKNQTPLSLHFIPFSSRTSDIPNILSSF